MTRYRPYMVRALFSLTVFVSFPLALPAQEKEKEQVKGVIAAPADAAEIRRQIAIVEELQPVVPDRGAGLYFLSTAKRHLGETRESLSLLKDCLALPDAFAPSGDPAFGALKGSKSLYDL